MASLLNYDDEKCISNNIEKIITGIKEIANVTIERNNFKEWKEDTAVMFEFRNVPIILEYNKFLGKYFILIERANEDVQYEIQCEAISLYNIFQKLKTLLCNIDQEYDYEKHKISNNINKCIEYGKKYLNITLEESVHFRDYYDDMAIYLTFNLQQFRITYDCGKRKYLLGHKNTTGRMKYSSDAYHIDGESSQLAEIFNRASTRHNPFKRGKIGHNTHIDELYRQIKK